jgi:prophage regulatory protein
MPITETDLDPFVAIEEVEAATSLHRTTIWRLRREGNFPEPTCISPGRVAWRKSQIVGWMARCGEIFDARRQRMNSKRDEARRRRVKKPEAAGRDKLNPVGPAKGAPSTGAVDGRPGRAISPVQAPKALAP